MGQKMVLAVFGAEDLLNMSLAKLPFGLTRGAFVQLQFGSMIAARSFKQELEGSELYEARSILSQSLSEIPVRDRTSALHSEIFLLNIQVL